MGFYKTCNFFQILSNYKYSKLCLPHFLFEKPCSTRHFFTKYWILQALLFFQILRNWKYSKLCFPIFFGLICPALSEEYFLSFGFHMTSHFFIFSGNGNILSNVFHTFCLIYPAMSDKEIGVYLLVSTRLVIFSDLRDWKYSKLGFPHFLFDIPSSFRRIFSDFVDWKYSFSTGLFIFLSKLSELYSLYWPRS